MNTLGERIRTMRKQHKLTLEALAGDKLTKAMLSYIENNKAKPSMESLSYIAERLGVEVSELLEDVSSQELRDVLKSVEKLFSEQEDKYGEIIARIKPYVERLNHSYEAARLLEIYSRSLYYEKKEGWKPFIEKAAALYDQLNITSRLAAIGIFQTMAKFREHQYEASLAMLLEERFKIESRNGHVEPLTRLDFDYVEALIHFVIGNSEEAIRVMNEGIAFSREQQLFYRLPHLYQLAIFNAMMNEDIDSMEYYGKKIHLYGELVDDRDAIPFTNYIRIHFLTSYKKSYAEALDLVQAHHAEYGFDETGTTYSFIEEKGKALYGLGRYEEALVCLENVRIPDFAFHPFDLSILYEKDAYAALCHAALGNKTEAKRLALLAVENITSMPDTPYRDFIMETYKLISEE